MSKSESGLFSGTKGTNEASKASGSEAKSQPTYTATASLVHHILNPEVSTSGRQGIRGAHHKENFLKEVNRIGAKIIGSTNNSQMNGIEKISYKMPKKDMAGKPTGGYQSKIHFKTVYNPSIISSQQYINRGLEAANNAAKYSSTERLDHEWAGIDNSGVKWCGYCDSNGNITSFYPDD